VETVILISMRTDADTAKALHDAAQFYKVDIEAIAAKVKQDFAAKEKAKATQKATAKPQTKAAKKSTAA
jgi:ParB family chromosome partitioning protein